MYNTLFVKIPQSQGNLAGIEFDLVLLEPSFRLEEPVELSSPDEWHDKEESEF